MSMTVLEVKNLTKSFGDTEVLKGINLTLGEGEALVIIGSSGSGKTTLLRCLNFLEEADGGEIIVGGETLWKTGDSLTEKEMREKRLRFGLVFQSFNLFPQYTVKRNITLAPELFETDILRDKYIRHPKDNPGDNFRDNPKDNSGVRKKNRAAFREERKKLREELSERADKLLASVGLTEKAKMYPWQLSGGQCQRAAIARALAMSPDVLCFDEPTSALDPELTGEVLRVIRELKKDGRTMVIVTHEMDFAREIGDKIVYMAGGVAEATGTPDEVFENERVKAFSSGVAAGAKQ